MSRILCTTLALCCAASLHAQTPPPLPEGVTQQMVDQGKALFAGPANCFACHGPEGAGTPLAPKLADGEWLHIDGSYTAIVDLVTKGVVSKEEARYKASNKDSL